MVLKKLFKILKKALGIKKRKVKKGRTLRARRGQARKLKRRQRLKGHRPRRSRRKTRRQKPRRLPKRKGKKNTGPAKSGQKKIQAQEVGRITHYFPRVNAAVVFLSKGLNIGAPVWIKGRQTNFKQTVGSMQINRNQISKARRGQEIGLEVYREVRPGDVVYLLGR